MKHGCHNHHGWGKYSVDSQDGVEGSTLSMYREALGVRKQEPGLGDGPMEWIEAGKDVVAFERPGDFACYINFGAPIQLPSNSQILVASGPVTGHTLPTDTAVWVRLVSLMTQPRRIHPAWIAALVTFFTLVATAGFRSAPSVSDRST